VFAQGYGDGLWMVSETGGPSRRLTELDREAGEASHRWPHFLPDGRSFLFVVKTTTMDSHDAARLAIGNMETGEHRILEAAGTSPAYLESGHVVYARAGGLFAARFDVDTLEIGSPERVLLADPRGRPCLRSWPE
jgi:hypothetical protein